MTAFPKAMVLAAGLGTRMRPLTDHTPKPLIKVGGVTLLDRSLDWLAASGVTEAVVNTHYRADMIRAHLATRRRPVIHLSHEEMVLETGGGVKRALPLLGERFFAVNSDAICRDGAAPALARLVKHWDENVMDALLLMHSVEKAVGYDGRGDYFVQPDGTLRPRGDTPAAPFVFTGVQLLHRRLFTGAPEGAFSLRLLYDRHLPRLRALAHDGDWLHVGDAKGLAQAEAFFKTHP